MEGLVQINRPQIDRLLDYPSLVDGLRDGFRQGATVPLRHHHTIPSSAGDAVLLLMPAWRADQVIGIKTVTVFPANSQVGLPGVMGTYMLLDGATGAPKALLDGQSLTVRRTAAASALAATYLAHASASTLLMVGTGSLAPELIAAHCAVRPIKRVLIWGRRPEQAARLAQKVQQTINNAETPTAGAIDTIDAIDDLETGVASADIISCATMAKDPLIRGDWLRPGQHLDLVGAFTPTMRESDDRCIQRADIYVDTIDGATQEGGDIVQPLNDGLIGKEDIKGDLFSLTAPGEAGRAHDDSITLFKSVGTALEDLVAAELAFARATQGADPTD